jgi:hypothetical protein
MVKYIDTTIELARFYDENGLLNTITIDDYNALIDRQDQTAIADFIYNRLHSRYIKPFQFVEKSGKFVKEYKNGFSIMANCCLLIETLQSFRNGWGDSNKKSEQAFKQFFSTDKNFQELQNKGREFYLNIRCGILHQGETTNGWKINREDNGLLFDEKQMVVDSITFIKRLDKSLIAYTLELKSEKWDSEIWDNFRTKMRKIISNCK